DIVLDKTGTLTEGSFSLHRIEVFGAQSESACLALAAGLEQGSSHPIGMALLHAAQQQGLAPVALAGPTVPRHVLGKGVQWQHGETCWRLGHQDFAGAAEAAWPALSNTVS